MFLRVIILQNGLVVKTHQWMDGIYLFVLESCWIIYPTNIPIPVRIFSSQNLNAALHTEIPTADCLPRVTNVLSKLYSTRKIIWKMVLGWVVRKQKFHIVEGLSLMPGFRCLTKKCKLFIIFYLFMGSEWFIDWKKFFFCIF